MKKMLALLGSVGLVATTGASVIGCGTKEESLKNLSLVQLKKRAIELDQEFNAVLEEIKNNGGSAWTKPQLLKKVSKLNFDLMIFQAKIFLETDYAIYRNRENDQVDVGEVDILTYIFLLEVTIESLDTSKEENAMFLLGNEDYFSAFNNYKTQLEKKLKTIAP